MMRAELTEAKSSPAPDPALPTEAWDDIYVGKDLGRRDVEVTPEFVQRFIDGCEDNHPWYTGPSPFGGPVAPALIGSQEPWRFSGWYPSDMRGNLHAKQEWDLFAPVVVGSTYTSRATVSERYLWRNNRHVIVNEILITNANGSLLARGRTHQSFLRQQPEGFVVDKAREKKEGRRFQPGEGDVHERIDGPSHDMTPELCLAAADGLQNYHSDPDIAQAMGFPAVVVQGIFNANIVSALMADRFGAGWWCGGKLRMSFVNVIWGGDTVGARVVLREIEEETPRARAQCEVWVEKADATVSAIGTASAVVGPAG
jgi:acyl dehydratase